MPPRKRKDPTQPKLEDTVEGAKPVTKKTKAGKLDKPVVEVRPLQQQTSVS